MSTTNNPPAPQGGTPAQPAQGWYPNLAGSNLTLNVQNSITQSYSLLYSLRDTVTSLQNTVAKMIQYGTSQRLAQVNAQAMPDGALWFETDTGKVYQAQLNPNTTTRDWVLVINGVPAT